ncbi:hypothetical protein [Paenibacillus segetis]|uniref:hypothetical protein n=1 Tax=Paenibacillus segetis TaxID=1325360 RepID=UPI001667675D|nr:hypothetical protein [Paenibacillus segetis]
MRSYEEQRQQNISLVRLLQREGGSRQGMPERRVLRRHKSSFPLAKQRAICWSECSKETTSARV